MHMKRPGTGPECTCLSCLGKCHALPHPSHLHTIKTPTWCCSVWHSTGDSSYTWLHLQLGPKRLEHPVLATCNVLLACQHTDCAPFDKQFASFQLSSRCSITECRVPVCAMVSTQKPRSGFSGSVRGYKTMRACRCLQV